LWINQDARFALTKLSKGNEISYEPKFKGNGVYIFVIDGAISIDNKKINKRDAIGVYDTNGFTMTADEDADILAIEVPMLS